MRPVVRKFVLLAAMVLISAPAYAHIDGASHAGLWSYGIATIITTVLFIGAVGIVHLFGRTPHNR
ncbi:MAG: hypothetical protein O3A84_04720 [Proteobacteria bacterium]|nr:hypothetical protein [Pseudomonadota bacterium]